MTRTTEPYRRRGRRAAAILAATLAFTGTAVAGTSSPAAAAEIDPGAYYQLISRHSGKAIEVEAGATGDAAPVVQWQPGDGQHQQFRFLDSGDGYYRLQARHSGKVLDVYEWNPDNGAEIRQWPDLNGDNQQFEVIDTDGGYVKLINRFSGKALDVWERSTADGARISQYDDTGGANQQWQLVRVDGDDDPPPPTGDARQVEDLDRGLISVRSGNGNLVSWRWLGDDPANVGFHVYRGSTRVTDSPVTGSTNFYDPGAPAGATYTVRAVVDGVEQPASGSALQFTDGYLDVPIQPPPGGSVPDGSYTYEANDASVGDLTGDGRYEIVLKWYPSNAKDNAHDGYTGNTIIDAYRLDGQRLWRIDLGRNIRSGAHYTQFQVYDYDGDGRAEVAMKTADGSTSGTGQVIGDPNADHRNSSGYILSGPEFLTMFDGATGAELSTVDYVPPRGDVSGWGDSYGNRVDRFLAGTAYLDGQRPSVIMARGYYTRSVIAAWDFRNGSLTQRWVFDSDDWGSQYEGQGNHQLSVADADGDGRDEIIYGAMAIDDDGSPLWNTGLGHGDALHVGQFDPGRAGLQVFLPSEWNSSPAARMVDSRNGQLVWTNPSCDCDNGRGVAADVWAGSPGAEAWSASVSGLYNTDGQNVGRKPGSVNFLSWWDGDPVRELLDDTHIDKYGPNGDTRLLTGSNVASNNGTKANPALSGDLFGDWREEVIWRTSDSTALRIYATGDQTDRRITTLLHDPQYRVAIAWQNTAYNQPPHPSFFIGDGMGTPPRPNVYVR